MVTSMVIRPEGTPPISISKNTLEMPPSALVTKAREARTGALAFASA
jgi:hypothetical protein